MSEDRPLWQRVTGEVSSRVVSAIDPDVVLDEIDVDALLDRVDVNRLLDRVDPNALLDRVDVDRLLDRVDPNRLLDRVDVDRLLAHVDLEAIIRRSGVPEIVAESTGAIGARGLDLLRRQLVALDVLIDKVTDTLLRRDFSSEPAGPARLVADARRDETRSGRRSVSGHYAGPVARAAALALDTGIVLATFTVGAAGIEFLARVFLGVDLSTSAGSPIALLAIATWAWIYSLSCHTIAGRTVGKAVVGVRVVTRAGHPLTAPRAFWRTLAFPLSWVGGLGFLLALIHREHLALHDLLAGTTSVYDWGERPAELSAPLTAFLERTTG